VAAEFFEKSSFKYYHYNIVENAVIATKLDSQMALISRQIVWDIVTCSSSSIKTENQVLFLKYY